MISWRVAYQEFFCLKMPPRSPEMTLLREVAYKQSLIKFLLPLVSPKVIDFRRVSFVRRIHVVAKHSVLYSALA